ncbi:MAG: DUF2849 domain-containing protein [Nannocystaceae bacterium]|nr:DUF2849 domain-containing protein [Nannocystaceae bacterium]
MARSFGSHFVITANTTDAGVPVYLCADRTWSPALTDAHAVENEDARDDLLSHARTQEQDVCDPYAFKVNVEDGAAVATTTRERIRSQGPTTPLRRPDASQA